MNQILDIDNVNAYNILANHKTQHPLISIVDFSKVKAKPEQNPRVTALKFDVYAVFLKESKHGNVRYGRNYYDYQEGTLIFIAPKQLISIEEDGEDYRPKGYALLFHPDLIQVPSTF